MSAPTALDAGAVARELAQRIPQQGGTTRDRRRGGGADRRRTDQLADLTRQHQELCTTAVDSSEIAAGLETAGVGDRQARTRYGVGSVFELAELMYDAVPCRPAEPAARPDPWHRPWWVSLARGVLYAAPALLYVVGLQLAGGPVHAGALLLATVLGNAATSALALLGHALLGRSETRAAGTLLRGAVLLGGPLLGTAAVATTSAAGLPVQTGLLLAGTATYLVSATVLLVLGAERALLLLLLPAVALAALSTSGAAQPPRWSLLLVLAATLLASAAEAVRRSPRAVGARPLAAVLDRELWRQATAHAGAGAVSAALVGGVVLDALAGHGSGHASAVPFAMAPLVAGLGVADWLVHRLRSRAHRALDEHTSPRAFGRWACGQVLRSLAVHTTALAGATLLLAVLLSQVGRPVDRVLALQTTAMDVLALVLLTCMVLLSLGRTLPVLLVGTAALVGDTAVRTVAGVRAAQPATEVLLAAAHIGVAAVALAVLVPQAAATLASVGRHR